MHALATFDRWLNDRASAACPPAEAERRLRAAHGATPADWLGLLADDRHAGAFSQSWRLALWRSGSEPQWLGPPLRAHAGQSAAVLRRQALSQALAQQISEIGGAPGSARRRDVGAARCPG